MLANTQAELLAAARENLRAGNPDDAEVLLQVVRNQGVAASLRADVAYLEALIALGKGDALAARNLLEPLVREPAYAHNYYLNQALAHAYSGLQQHQQAIDCLARMLGQDASQTGDWELLLRERILRGDELTLKDLALPTQLLSQQRDTASVLHRYQALALARAGRHDVALRAYEAYFVTRIDPERIKRDWYNHQVAERSTTRHGESQRFTASDAALQAELSHIASQLQLDPGDELLDIGGAGGLLAERLAGMVSAITVLDVSAALIEKARERNRLPNVAYHHGDILTWQPGTTFSKILMAGVTPVMKSFSALSRALARMHEMLPRGGRSLVSNNYDIASAATAAGFALEHARASGYADSLIRLNILEEMLWLDSGTLAQACAGIGFAQTEIVNERVLPDQRRMFDLVLVK